MVLAVIVVMPCSVCNTMHCMCYIQNVKATFNGLIRDQMPIIFLKGVFPIRSVVVIAACDDDQIVPIDPIDQAVGFINAPRPKAREVFFERFRLADTLERFPQAVLDQVVDPLQGLAILSLPILGVFPGGDGPGDALKHPPGLAESACLCDIAQWSEPDGRHWQATSTDGPSPSGC